MDEDLIKNNARFMKKIEEKWEREIVKICELDLDLRILLLLIPKQLCLSFYMVC
jgi:hypothetical protein